ncbi:MAG: GxxExxY protein [Planctomycetaceae bacterium]|nr:GxxExxY protein [Planctomycetaceae bacterium]
MVNDELTKRVIGAAFQVHNTLGSGFLEAVYERALSIELNKLGIPHERQAPLKVTYDGHIVGEFAADILIEGELVVELKAVAKLATVHEVQLVNYLAATGINIGLLINFGPDKVDVKRKYRTYTAH